MSPRRNSIFQNVGMKSKKSRDGSAGPRSYIGLAAGYGTAQVVAHTLSHSPRRCVGKTRYFQRNRAFGGPAAARARRRRVGAHIEFQAGAALETKQRRAPPADIEAARRRAAVARVEAGSKRAERKEEKIARAKAENSLDGDDLEMDPLEGNDVVLGGGGASSSAAFGGEHGRRLAGPCSSSASGSSHRTAETTNKHTFQEQPLQSARRCPH